METMTTCGSDAAAASSVPTRARSLDGPVRKRAIAYAEEIARSVRNHCRVLEVGIEDAMMPAEAVEHLDAARACLDRMIHRGRSNAPTLQHSTSTSGISAEAMRAVQRVRAALDGLSHNIEQWRTQSGGEGFPETVLEALGKELGRGCQIARRATAIGKEA